MTIPFVDLVAQTASIRSEIDAAIDGVLGSARFVGGPVVETFEAEFARYCGARHAVGVGNGTDALLLALRACGAGPGSEVIAPAFTFTATAEAIVNAGARPVFVDVDETYTLDVGEVEDRITPRTRAIVAVHLYGQPANADALREIAERHGLCLIEDAAQAHGARDHGRPVGSLGHIACFSFYPSKPLGAMGDGGAVVTDDERYAAAARLVGDHGRSSYYLHDVAGINSRLDALQAAILRVKLAHVDDWNAARRRAARAYDARLAPLGLAVPRVAPGREHVYHLYVIRSPQRDRLRERLSAAGIQTGLHYPVPLHLQPAYRDLGYRPGSLPNSEAWAGEILSLPMYAELTDEQIDEVARAIESAGEPAG